jgi:hypothetical protein
MLFMIVPAGIYPVFGLFRWRRSDPIVRAWIATTAIVFGVYYVIAFVSLHYFVPVMLTPLVVFWRQRLFAAPRTAPILTRSRLAAGAILAATSIAVALPAERSMYTAAREVGATVDIEGLEGYAQSDPSVFRGADLLSQLFVVGWSPEVPDEAYAGSAIAWNHYARRGAAGGEGSVYRLQACSLDDPPAEKVGANDVAELYVLDPAGWEHQRRLHPRGSLGQSLYMISRDVLFAQPSARRRAGVFSLSSLWSGK